MNTDAPLTMSAVFATVANASGPATHHAEGFSERGAVVAENVVRVAATYSESVGRNASRGELLRQLLFGASTSFDIVGGGKHHTAMKRPSGTYVNEEAAARSLLACCPASEKIEVIRDPWEHNEEHSAVLLGSSRSSEAVESIMGSPEAPRFVFEGTDYIATFPYSFFSVGGRLTRIQDGKPHTTDRRVIVDDSRHRVAGLDWTGTELKSDLLLMMKMPKNQALGTDMIVLAGVHGPGMRGVELLVDVVETADLTHLIKYSESTPYFQALFRVDAFEVRDGNTVPRQITLLKDLIRPVRVRV